MKLPLLFVLIAVPALAQVYVEKETTPPPEFSKTFKVENVRLRQKIEDNLLASATVISFGGFHEKERVSIDTATGDVSATVSDEKAAEIIWNALSMMEQVRKVIKADGADLSLGAVKYGDADSGGVISVSPQSAVLVGKKTWIGINLATGQVKWKKGMVPSAKSRLIWDAVQLYFPTIKAKVKAE